jgi:hypothetical protein
MRFFCFAKLAKDALALKDALVAFASAPVEDQVERHYERDQKTEAYAR